MVKLTLFVIIFGTAAACGLGILSYSWLLATFAAIYISSILDESNKVPNADFQQQNSEEFNKSELNIKRRVGVRVAHATITVGIAFLISQFL